MSLTPIDIDPSKLEDNDDFVEDMFNPSPYNAVEAPSRMPQADCVDHNDVPVLAQSMTDTLIYAEVILPQGEMMTMGKVISRSMNEYGRVINSPDDDPMLSTLVYDPSRSMQPT